MSARADHRVSRPTLGVLGGGQLGRMLVHAAERMGMPTVVLDTHVQCPAGQVSQQTVVAAYDDPKGWAQLADACDGITTEFENVPAAALEWLAARRPVSPPAAAVARAQDRIREKQHFVDCQVPCAPYFVLQDQADLAQVPDSHFPAILKTARLGYDGKGQITVQCAGDLATAWNELGRVPCVLEQRLALALECSVIVARNAQGQVVHFAPQRNVHHGGILATSYAFDDAVPGDLARQLIEATTCIARGLHYVGVLCVEFFVLQDGRWVVNEMAPRPHNSGHHTIDACDHSQFDLQVRTTMGLPLVQPRQHSAAILLNLLGDLWLRDGQVSEPPWAQVQQWPGVHLHLYGKYSVKPGRKMGHITVTAADAAGVQQLAAQVAQVLGLPFQPLN